MTAGRRNHTELAEPGGPAAALQDVHRAVAQACTRSGRDPGTVTLIAISKTVGPERIEPVLRAGHRVFGENRVQEARAKWPALRAAHPDIKLHLVGQLQTNKVREAVALFDAIHSVDRPSLCAALARECTRQGRRPQLLVQVNTGAEAQKAGILTEEADQFLISCRDTFGLEIDGLMCIPPVDAPPAPHYARLAEIASRHRLALLSMGMSRDFAVSIQMGATHVRVGSAIFGDRSQEAPGG